MIWFGLAWNLLIAVLVVRDPHPRFDLAHCAVDRVRFEKVCFPKDGCWLDREGNANCWRRAKLVTR